jgi:hypothetical protein
VRDVLYQVVRDHYETFRAQTASIRDGTGLPRFVEEEFRAFLRCGFLAGGFVRFRCAGCGLDRFVPFSCCAELRTMWSLSPEAGRSAARSARTGSFRNRSFSR